MKAYFQKTSEEYKKELNFFSKVCKVDIENVLLYNFIYEYDSLSMCTSIIVKNPEGDMNLFSNLDFGFPENASDMSFLARISKNGQLIIEANFIFGFAGFSRFYKKGKFAFALNTRP